MKHRTFRNRWNNGIMGESKSTKYYARAIKRFSKVILWLFILYLAIMVIVWSAPKVRHWALV